MRPAAVDLELMIHKETERAVLVSSDGNREAAVWLPKISCQFEEPIREGRAQIVTTYERLAIEKGLA